MMPHQPTRATKAMRTPGRMVFGSIVNSAPFAFSSSQTAPRPSAPCRARPYRPAGLDHVAALPCDDLMLTDPPTDRPVHHIGIFILIATQQPNLQSSELMGTHACGGVSGTHVFTSPLGALHR